MVVQEHYRSTAILIIDDFGPWDRVGKRQLREYGQPDQVEPVEGDTNCVVRPDGQGHYGAKGASTAGSNRPHGELVFKEARKILQKALKHPKARDYYGYEESYPNFIRQVVEWEMDEGRLMLVSVDTDGFTTGRIRANTNGAIALLKKEGIEGFVLNMSFAIIPCENHLERAEALETGLMVDALVQLVAEWQEDPERARIEFEEMYFTCKGEPALELGELVQGRARLRASYPLSDSARSASMILNDLYTEGFLAGDPLREWLTVELYRQWPELTVIPVAASGNLGESGYDYPFAPASFDEVVSVGAEDEEKQQRRESYANPSEVVLDGRHHPDGGGPAVRGTSFATPKFSAMAGIYLLGGGQVPCGSRGEGEVVRPPLGYARDEGQWRDLPLKKAIEDFCPDFPDLPQP